jgi:hypothetical protein
MNKNRVLKSRTSLPVYRIKEELLDFDPIKLMKFYNKFESLLKEKISYAELGELLRICLVITQDKTQPQWNFFDENYFLTKLRNNDFATANVIILNCDGDVAEVRNEFIDEPKDAANLSNKIKDKLVIFINCREIFFLINAKLIHNTRDIVDERRIGILTKKALPVCEYRQLIENQYNEEVQGERGFRFWQNKTKRFLLDSPEITFHKPLWAYLNNFVLDGKVDSEVSLSGTSDRTDIRILSFSNEELYIIELKCLGRCNENQKEKSDDWANHGILQLKEYLNDEKNSTKGLLVLYDGRNEDKEISWISKEEWHEKTDENPMKFYLISEGASIRAKKKLKALKKR